MRKALLAMTALWPTFAFAQTATSTPCPATMIATTTAGTVATSGWSVSGGKIYLNGQPFVARGVNLYDQDMPKAVTNSAGQPMTSAVPKVNFIRLNVFEISSDSTALLQPFIATWTALGIIVELEYHPYGTTLSGSDLQSVARWYAAMSGATKGNSNVIFGTQNEPAGDGSGVDNEVTTIYNAVRGTGNDTLIMVVPSQGTQVAGMSPSTTSGMHNIAFDLHFYNWISGYSTSLATNESALANEIAGVSNFTSADGRIPIIVGEYGEAADVENALTPPDPGGMEVLEAVQNAVATGEISGAIYWEWSQSGNLIDAIVQDSGTSGPVLNPYGTTAAGFIASGSAPTAERYDGSQYASQLCSLTQAIYPTVATDAATAEQNALDTVASAAGQRQQQAPAALAGSTTPATPAATTGSQAPAASNTPTTPATRETAQASSRGSQTTPIVTVPSSDFSVPTTMAPTVTPANPSNPVAAQDQAIIMQVDDALAAVQAQIQAAEAQLAALPAAQTGVQAPTAQTSPAPVATPTPAPAAALVPQPDHGSTRGKEGGDDAQ